MVTESVPVLEPDIRRRPGSAGAIAAGELAQARAFIGVPLMSSRGRLVGTLSAYAGQPTFPIGVAGTQPETQPLAYAAVLRHECRAGDALARMGGDEFGVLAVECDQASVRVLAERLNAHLRAVGPRQGDHVVAGASLRTGPQCYHRDQARSGDR